MKLLLSWLLACAALIAFAGAGCSSLAAATTAEESAPEWHDEPAEPVAEAATCCVDGGYFSCPHAAAAAQCLGEPLHLASCMGNCTGTDGACESDCIGKYGPEPSACRRDPGQDASCTPPWDIDPGPS